MSKKELPIRIKIKGKTVGRPSNFERILSEFVSTVVDSEEYKKIMTKHYHDLALYGVAKFPLKEINELAQT